MRAGFGARRRVRFFWARGFEGGRVGSGSDRAEAVFAAGRQDVPRSGHAAIDRVGGQRRHSPDMGTGWCRKVRNAGAERRIRKLRWWTISTYMAAALEVDRNTVFRDRELKGLGCWSKLVAAWYLSPGRGNRNGSRADRAIVDQPAGDGPVSRAACGPTDRLHATMVDRRGFPRGVLAAWLAKRI